MAQPPACQQVNDEARLKEKLGNVRWRLDNLYYITNKQGLKEKFKLNNAQRYLLDNMWYLNIVLKARQLGMTTFIQIFILDACLFNSNTKAGVIAHNQDDAQKFFREKIKFAYENLPDWLKSELKAKNDRAQELVFSNGSSISVGTSMRSGTLQYLHISEFGKLCAKYPAKAREIVTGAINAVEAGQFIFIESTAEGQEGAFYNFCETAQNAAKEGRELTELDFKFFFFPWWGDSNYKLSGNVIVPSEEAIYFADLEVLGITLSKEQKNWYVKKKATQGDDMKREFPSTPEEAFEQSVDGAYYHREMASVRKEKRILKIPYSPQLPVHVFMDLGRDDATSMWFMQDYYSQFRFIRYHEGSGESIQFYLKYMQTLGYVFGDVYLPHDANIADYSRADNKTRADIVRSMGFRVIVVPRVPEKIEAIQAVRDVLHQCYFDEENASLGIKHLDAHRKEWDDKYGRWRDRPFHGPASHGADAFEQFARGYKEETYQHRSFEPDSQIL